MQSISHSSQSQPRSIQGYAPLPRPIVLIIEDDENIGALLAEVLAEETAYQPLLATDGLQALQLIRFIRPNLIITDYRLPYMDGLELYDRLHTTNRLEDVPAILISAHLPAREEVRRRHLIGISKPFELDDLLHTIHKLSDKRAS